MPKKDERFIVGIYVDDENVSQEGFEDFNLTLNNETPKKIALLSENDPRLKDISFVSEWSRFFLVTFPYIDSDRLTMVFESAQYGKGTLHFAKRAKYIYTGKAY